MAYSMVSPLVNNLSQLLLSEAIFLREVDTQVRCLHNELEHMTEFLKHADRINVQTNNMVVAGQTRDVASRAEDVVEKYVLKVAKEKRRNKVMKILRSLNKATWLHFVGEQIKQLQTLSKQIRENRDNYQVPQMDANDDIELQMQRIRKEVEEDNVVGFVQEAETLVHKLVPVPEEAGTQELDFISISGMAGLGKTTLATKVYNDPSVRGHFSECHAWVIVSHKFNLKELLLKILRKVTQQITEEEISKMNEEELKQNLKNRLSNRRYLIVLDDIWSNVNWDELKKAFPNDTNGSRVFVTTRHKEVAFHVSGSPQLELRFLDDNESWQLFTGKAFRQEPCPENLNASCREIVRKCGGLPLAIALLGGLLENRPFNIWENMVRDVRWHLERETLCLDILALSYRHMRPELRPCFLYLGLFPEIYEIPTRQLIQLWISEGFIKYNDEARRKKEDVAEIYLQQLIDRNLIQVKGRASDSGIKTCSVHNLIHGLCLKLSKDEKFLESHSLVPSEVTKPRRLSIHCSRRDYISNADSDNVSSVRTLLCFNQDNHGLSKQDWKSLFKCIKLLRVLDMGDQEVQKLPKAIEKLTLLKYLRVKTTDIARVPSSLCALRSLQTLDLRWSRISHLPEGIWSMKQLRHLYVDGRTSLPKNTGRKRLFTLQTLCYISPIEGVNIADKAPNLRKLGLYGYHCRSLDQQISTFNLPNLECLKLANGCTFDVLIALPQTVTKISMKAPFLQPETIQIFQQLSELRVLKLDGPSFTDEKLRFEEGWFPKLKLLKIQNSSMQTLEFGPEAVPNLKRVVISACPMLNPPHYPDGVEVA